jgi:hypothetical protein
MHGPPRKEFYASLMAMPNLSPEQRQRIKAQVRAWISAETGCLPPPRGAGSG